MRDIVCQIDAEIIPDMGLGGLLLRSSIEEILRRAPSTGAPHRERKSVEVVYKLAAGAVEAAVDARNGKVFRLTARRGYQGKLFGVVGVGMRVRHAIALDPHLYYDEAEDLVLCRGVEGLAVELAESDPPPHLVPDMEIHAISVYAKEIVTAEGQAAGRW